MISRDEMFRPLLQADPTFQATWDAFLAKWQDEPDPAPLYLALGDLARHLVRRLETGDTAVFDAVFDVVERWHTEGDASVREAATVGLLEDLQNLNLHRTTRPEAFLPWLRPESRRWWDKVDAFWRHGTLLQDN